MQLNERAAYLKGLMEGVEIDKSTKQGKVLCAMYELLEELCSTVTELDNDVDQVFDELDAMDEDLDELEEFVFGDEDEDDDDCDCDCDDCDCDCDDADVQYELTCPNCNAVTVVDEDTLLNEQICCGNCGAEFEIEFSECEGDCECCADDEEDEEKK